MRVGRVGWYRWPWVVGVGWVGWYKVRVGSRCRVVQVAYKVRVGSRVVHRWPMK